MAALPKSPVGIHRRSSSGSSLRPVLPFGLDDNSAVDLEEVEDEDESEMGPMPREQSGPFAQGGGVDEVEYAYGYVIFFFSVSINSKQNTKLYIRL